MNPEMIDLLESINAKKAEVKDLVKADKLDEAEASKKELIDMQKKFDLLKDMDEQKTEQIKEKKEGAKIMNEKTNAVKDFANAARHGFKNSVNETTGANGGYVVPEDIQTQINQYKQANASLLDYVSVENVTTNKGARTYQTKAEVTGFVAVDEGGTITEMQEPTFERISYAVKDYAGFLPVTNDVLNDTDANLTGTITEWIGKQSIATANREILKVLKSGDATDFKDINGIKKALNVTLGQAYKPTSVVLTNDTGLNYLDTLEDKNGRPLLNPNPTEPNALQLRVGATVVPIVVVPNAVLADGENGAIPFIVGDLAEAVEVFDRQQTTIEVSNTAAIGSFNAFAQNMTLFRAIEREDIVAKDKNAAVYGTITVSTTA